MLLNKDSSSIKAFIFDHDGVIADTEPINKKAWMQFFSQNLLEVDDLSYENQVRGRSTKSVIQDFFPNLTTNGCLDLIEVKRNIYIKLLSNNIKAIKGIVDFIKISKANNMQISVASSATKERVDFTLIKLNINKYVDHIVTSEDITHSKPDPEVFLKVAKKFKLSPKDCLVFEDSIPGLQAAKNAQMKAVYVNSSNIEVDSKLYDYTISDFVGIKPSEYVKI